MYFITFYNPKAKRFEFVSDEEGVPKEMNKEEAKDELEKKILLYGVADVHLLKNAEFSPVVTVEIVD